MVLGPLETRGLWAGDPQDPPGDPDAAAAAPEGGDLRLDYLTDGVVTEKNVRPFEGMRMSPLFGGEGITGARALGLEPVSRPCRQAFPTWEKFIARRGTFVNDEFFDGATASHATYAACYLRNDTGSPLTANLAFDSAGAFIAYLDGTEVAAYEPGPCSSTACARPLGPEDAVTNLAPVTMEPGEHFLLTRVHCGSGRSGFRLRFQDPQGQAILPPALTVSLHSISSPPEVRVTRILSKDNYRVGSDPLAATLRVESNGSHAVTIREDLPLAWSAEGISDGGALEGGQVIWSLSEVSGVKEVSYRLIPGDCPGEGNYCQDAAGGSEFSVDGQNRHAIRGDLSFKRDSEGTGDLGPWTAQDIGASGGGNQRYGSRGIDVSAQGLGVFASQDEFRFISLPATGDFEISAKVQCIADPGGSGQFGVMARNSFDPSAACVFLYYSANPAGGGTLTARVRSRNSGTASGNLLFEAANREVSSLPIWIKLARAGARISFQRSGDGAPGSFREIAFRDIGVANGTQVDLKESLRVGLAASSYGLGTSLVRFRDVNGVPEMPEFPDLAGAVAPPQNLVARPGNGQTQLTWESPPSDLPAPTGYVVLRNGVKLAEKFTAEPTYTDLGVLSGQTYCYEVQTAYWSARSIPSGTACATPEARPKQLRRGDVDGNGRITVTDPVLLLSYLFLQRTALGCLEAGDTDNSGAIDISDVIANLSFQFLGGTAPDSPGPYHCGFDSVAPDLGCERSCE